MFIEISVKKKLKRFFHNITNSPVISTNRGVHPNDDELPHVGVRGASQRRRGGQPHCKGRVEPIPPARSAVPQGDGCLWVVPMVCDWLASSRRYLCDTDVNHLQRSLL